MLMGCSTDELKPVQRAAKEPAEILLMWSHAHEGPATHTRTKSQVLTSSADPSDAPISESQ